jgi:acyl carrier protein
MANTFTWDSFQNLVCGHLGLEKKECTNKTNLFRDLSLDSLGIVSLGLKIHSEFQVNVPLSEVSNIKTLGEMFSITEKYMPDRPNS